MPSTVNIIAVPPWMLGQLWPRVGPFIAKCILAGETTDIESDVMDVADGIVHGRYQLWVVLQEDPREVLAAFCTSILEDADGKTVHVHSMGGTKLKSWGHLTGPTLDAFAKAEGARAVTYAGREGWTRVLPATAVVANGKTIFERAVA